MHTYTHVYTHTHLLPPGGERNRLQLASVLRQGGNLLLGDELTNDIDVHTLRCLETAILNFAGSALLISHDRYFLDRIATHILAFEGDSKVLVSVCTHTPHKLMSGSLMHALPMRH